MLGARLRPERQDHDTPLGQLLNERLRQALGRRGDDDAVVGRVAQVAGKAIAENPNVPTAAAIANAVADATGVRLFDLPLTSEKVYWALKNKVTETNR